MREQHHVVGWKVIAKASCYAISTDGAVMRVALRADADGRGGKVGKVLKHAMTASGYPCVNLATDDGKWRVIPIHALLGAAFLKRPDDHHYQVAHLDGDKTNFRLSNLEWKTAKGNADDALRHKTRALGNKHANTKIPDEMLPMIRAWQGSALILAERLGVSRHTITRIRAGTERKMTARDLEASPALEGVCAGPAISAH